MTEGPGMLVWLPDQHHFHNNVYSMFTHEYYLMSIESLRHINDKKSILLSTSLTSNGNFKLLVSYTWSFHKTSMVTSHESKTVPTSEPLLSAVSWLHGHGLQRKQTVQRHVCNRHYFIISSPQKCGCNWCSI